MLVPLLCLQILTVAARLETKSETRILSGIDLPRELRFEKAVPMVSPGIKLDGVSLCNVMVIPVDGDGGGVFDAVGDDDVLRSGELVGAAEFEELADGVGVDDVLACGELESVAEEEELADGIGVDDVIARGELVGAAEDEELADGVGVDDVLAFGEVVGAAEDEELADIDADGVVLRTGDGASLGVIWPDDEDDGVTEVETLG